jgi:mitogen-activated protein kinase 1/3
LFLVLEYSQSDLKKVLKSSMELTEMHVQTIIYNLLLGIKYMHSKNVLHRDIKPGNILVNADSSIKICDFGLSRYSKSLSRTKECLLE